MICFSAEISSLLLLETGMNRADVLLGIIGHPKVAHTCFCFTASCVVQEAYHPLAAADVHLHVQYPLRSKNKHDLWCFCGINRAERRVAAIFLCLRRTLPYHF